MKVKVQNIAKIKSSEIEINGITIIAGYNSTGKSTISKSLVYTLRGYSDLRNKIFNNRISSMMSAASPHLRYSSSEYSQLEKAMGDLASNPSLEISDELVSSMVSISSRLSKRSKTPDEIRQRIEHYRKLSDSEYAKFIINKSIQDGFGGCVNTIGCDEPGTIQISGDSVQEISIEIKDNQVSTCPNFDSAYSSPIYIEPRHILDEIASNLPFSIMDIDMQMELHSELMSDTKVREVSMADDDDVKKAFLIAKNFRGNIPISDTASGIKSMAYILRLLENRMLKRGDILVIDEPEMNLHPEWQLTFADFLVQLSKELNINVLLNTHSPYFLRAIDVYSSQHDTRDLMKLYMTIPSDDTPNVFVTKDCTDCPENAFEPLYRPFERL